MSYFKAPLKSSQCFPQGCLCISLICQVSTALLPDHMARPLATAHESIKTQTQKLLPLFNSITAKKMACNSAYQANLSSPSSEWWKMLSIHLASTIHKPSSFLFISYELFTGYCPSGNRIQQLLTQFQNQSQGKRGSLLLSIYLLFALPRKHDST